MSQADFTGVINLQYPNVGWLWRLKLCWFVLFHDAVRISGLTIEQEAQHVAG